MLTAATTGQQQEVRFGKNLIHRYDMAVRSVNVARHTISPCKSAENAIVFYRGKVWKYQKVLGEEKLKTYYPERKLSACAYKRFAASLWRGLARKYRKTIESHFTLFDFKVVDGNNAWFKAVAEAQKPYPGTRDWLISCSSTEGGWGKWVPNSDGAPPGGWMQMYHSTWYSMWYGWYGNEGAYSYLKSKGYRIPRSAHSWYSPLGQALASAHGKLNGRGGEWHSTGCYS